MMEQIEAEEYTLVGADFISAAVVISSAVYEVGSDSSAWFEEHIEPILSRSAHGHEAYEEFVKIGLTPSLVDYRVSRVLRNVRSNDSKTDAVITKEYNDRAAQEYNSLYYAAKNDAKFGIDYVLDVKEYKQKVKLRIITCTTVDQLDAQTDAVVRNFR
jgi:hypothetical protein